MRSVAFTLLASAGIAGAALAAAPALAQTAAPFTGARVEGTLGWDRLQNDGHRDGLDYGIGAGYDVQMGGAVVGAEAELSDASTRQCYGSYSVADPRYCARAGRDIYVGGRIGKVIGGGRTLLYAKAGYTNARVRLTEDDGSGSYTLDHRNLDGVRVGAGLEYSLTPNSFVKTEYRYSNYQDDFTRHQVVAGFGVRF